MKTYYLVMLRGVPIEAFTHSWDAQRAAKERSVREETATVLEVAPVQLELDFDEQPTKETCTYPHCDHAKGLCFSNYEIG